MRSALGPDLDGHRNPLRSEGFCERLSSEALNEFESLKVSINFPAYAALFIEEQIPSNIMFLVEGQVKLSMNSNAGRRIILGIANPGETLGLAAALSGSRYDLTAETICPCRIVLLDREDFLRFLVRNPLAYANLVRELCLDCARACEQVRTLGLTATAPAKLARLLLEWCAGGQKTERGTRLFCSLTHGEIGECIGASRETVTRIFSEFRYQELLESRGSTLIISNRRALEIYAGMD
jgi:CRP/FNR family transcriptional regulator, cyclic AMP receptor protein